MNSLKATIDHKKYSVKFESPQHIGIPLNFNRSQPNHFGAPQASAEALRGEGFIGSTKLGGSCNVARIGLVPHCNGTHTECVGHISREGQAIHQFLEDSLITANLIKVTPQLGKNTSDRYLPNKEDSDSLISLESIERTLSGVSQSFFEAIIVRTLPNWISKREAVYCDKLQPPFFSLDAMEYLKKCRVKHLLVDFPSIDKMYDEGKLGNHHCFWELDEVGNSLPKTESKTITEMIYVPDDILDGQYLLNLQIPAFMSDAAPSRPILYPLEEES